jgi:hypothetical protein
MGFIYSYAFQQWVIQFLIVLFFVGALLGLGVGVCLLACTARTLRFFNVMNRWVSMRRALRPIEIPRDTTQAVQRHRYLLAGIFLVGAVYSLFILITRFDPRAVIYVFNLKTLSAPIASWLIESVRWLLIAGNLLAIGVAIMLGFFPAALVRLEAKGGRWYSTRRAFRGVDTMHVSLDKLVAAFPRISGLIITVATLLLVIGFGTMLLGLR